MRIPCPHCGIREEEEFSYGGAAGQLPALDGLRGPKKWRKALHMRPNPKGDLTELWCHASGCERWLIVIRNTTSQSISQVRDAGQKSGQS